MLIDVLYGLPFLNGFDADRNRSHVAAALRARSLRAPFFADLYQHLLLLWRTGGIYSDFSTVALDHLESAAESDSYSSFPKEVRNYCHCNSRLRV
jgi:hypothetical protein